MRMCHERERERWHVISPAIQKGGKRRIHTPIRPAYDPNTGT